MSKLISLASRLALIAVPLALAGAGTAAGVSEPKPQGAAQVAQAEVGGFSQKKLQSYAEAVKEVQKIDQAWQPKMSEAKSAEEVEAMTQQATNEMISGIEAQGLTVKEYNDITKAAEQDQKLYDHIMTLLAQAPE